MVSTINKAGCPVRSIAARMSAIRLVAPVDVSLWTTITALIACAASLCEPGFDLGGVGAATPVAGNEIDLDPEAARHLAPQGRKVAGLHHQDLVAGRKRIDDRGLPGACP